MVGMQRFEIEDLTWRWRRGDGTVVVYSGGDDNDEEDGIGEEDNGGEDDSGENGMSDVVVAMDQAVGRSELIEEVMIAESLAAEVADT